MTPPTHQAGTTVSASSGDGTGGPSSAKLWLNALAAAALLYLFLVGVSCLSGGIKGLGAGVMNQYLGDDLNPFLALLGGILSTTLVQSSSVTTSLVVGLVASGEVSTATAIPMIMGANIGTTVTNTVASLAHATRSNEFRRAFAAATCHDFFNFLTVITLLPLELLTRWASGGPGLLERMSSAVATWTMGAGGAKYNSPFKVAIKTGRKVVKHGLEGVFDDSKVLAVALAVVGCLVIFAALALIVRVMRTLVLSRMERYLNRFLGRGGLMGFVVGIVLTLMVPIGLALRTTERLSLSELSSLVMLSPMELNFTVAVSLSSEATLKLSTVLPIVFNWIFEMLRLS